MLIDLLLIINVIADFWSQLTRLEWMWGMQYDSLKLDTEANRIYRVLSSDMSSTATDVRSGLVRHDLLESFDSNRWLLLPSPEMINKIWDHYMTFVDDSTNSKQHPHIETVRVSIFC